MAGKILDNGTLVTLGIVGVVAAVGLARTRGSAAVEHARRGSGSAAKTYILIDNGCDDLSYPTDTTEEIQAAQTAMRAAGLDEARVWVGDGPDAMMNGQLLFAYAPVLAAGAAMKRGSGSRSHTEEETPRSIGNAASLDELLAVLLADQFTREYEGMGYSGEPIDTDNLPTFGGSVPRDTSLIYSWDEGRLLTHGVRGQGWQIVARSRK